MNVDKANSRGVEASMKLPLAREWSMTSSYTFTKSEQKSGQYKGQPLNQLPKHLFTTTVNWQPSDALQAWARVNYRGKESQPITGPSSSSLVAPSYTFVDLGGSYQLNKDRVGVRRHQQPVRQAGRLRRLRLRRAAAATGWA